MDRIQIISRKHGLQLPFNKYQISSWALFGVELFITVLVYIPPLEPTHRIAFGAVLLSLLCTTFFCAFKSSYMDPTDPIVYSERDMREQGEDFVTELKHYCSICDTHVQPRTKHCGQCNRCVSVFDHHCQWLNNCVGARNYGYFAKLIVLLFVNSSVKLGVGGYLLSQYYKQNHEFSDNVQEFYSTEFDIGFLQYLVMFSCALNVVFWLMMLQLIILHLWLHSQNLTTYEYIVLKRERMTLAQAQKDGIPLSSVRKSKTIRRIDEDDQTGRTTLPPQSVDDHTVSKLIKKGKPSVSYDHSHFYASHVSHDITKEDFAKHRTMDRPPETAEPFGTAMTSMPTQHAAFIPEKKLKLNNMTPAAVLHETSMSNDFSVNDSSTHGGIRGTAIYDKEIVSKEMPETATKSPQSFSVIKERCEEEVATMRDQYAPRIQEQIRHITFPEIMDEDMSIDKSHETSKIMRFMETISENVVMKNPLGKIMFVKSGIDIDGSSQQAHLVKDVIKPVLPKLDFHKGHTFRPVESPHELKLLKSDLYYVNSPNNRIDPMFSPSTLLPKSCRIQYDRHIEHHGNHSYVTERPAYMESEFAPKESDSVAEDKPISKKDLRKHQEPEGIKNPFAKV